MRTLYKTFVMGGGGEAGYRVQYISCRELYAVHSTANDIVQCTEYCSTA